MSKRKGWKAEQRRHQVSGQGTQISAKILEKVSVIRESAWRRAGEDSSSSEEGEEKEEKRQGVVSRTLANYLQLLEGEGEPERNQPALSLLHLTASWSCLICLSSVRRIDAVWNCDQCGCMFHLVCVQQWARDSLTLPPSPSPLSPHLFPDVATARTWTCPKCRRDYTHSQVPTFYHCFCKKKVNPDPDPWLLPHSCGETCDKLLPSNCGHRCASLCHPGTCPPCPRTVEVGCFCGWSKPLVKRCGSLGWSCGRVCGRVLSCQLHTCEQRCHDGECPECVEVIDQPCRCGKLTQERPCSHPEWSCEAVCGKLLSCGYHHCNKICHTGGCGRCPSDGERTCPCGKKQYVLACTEDVPTCGDTCDKLLLCGVHRCTRLCHAGSCGQCLQMAEKSCRCGKKTKLVPCSQEFLCESRCSNLRQCGKHYCKRKCCDGKCPACEQVCGKPLGCRNHKCAAPCHLGPCYPCVLTADVSCFCGATKVIVLCGKQKSTRPPHCHELCTLPSVCHHPRRQAHRCHFGLCPSCSLPCSLPLPCGHLCSARCHSEPHLPARKPGQAPWMKLDPIKKVIDPCPPCMQPVQRACRGVHEVNEIPCSQSRDYSCERECGRLLSCGNHRCQRGCHVVVNPPSQLHAGEDCLPCERGCEKPRPQGCTHSCPLPCHPGECPECDVLVKLACYCATMHLYVKCSEWCAASDDKKQQLQCCNSQCTKQLTCGHRCPLNCHHGDCPSQSTCKKRVSIRCSCRRIKKEFRCCERETVSCDEDCLKIITERKKEADRLEQERLEREEREKRLADEALEKQLRPRRRKARQSHQLEEHSQPTVVQKIKARLGTILIIIIALLMLLSLALGLGLLNN